MKIIVFALAFALLGLAQEQTLEEKVVAAEKREAAAKAALDAAEAKYSAELKNRRLDELPPHDPFPQRVEWLESSRVLNELRREKLIRDLAAIEAVHKARMAEINSRKAEAVRNFCASSAKALADEKTPEGVKKTFRELREHFSCK